MKRHLLLLLVALLPILANAYDAKIDGIYYDFSGDEAIVTYESEGFNSYSGTVAIPESVTYSGKTYRVTSIREYAFSDCSGLTSVTIGSSVTTIGDDAFYGCTSLTSITIPNSVTSIGEAAFNDCCSLTSITIGSDVTNIGNRAFYGCSSLTDVYCHAEIVPSTDLYAFDGTPISSATLHVLAGSVSAYKAKAPWKSFRRIVAIE